MTKNTPPLATKETMIQHLCVKVGMDKSTAKTSVETIIELIEDTLKKEGKVMLKNIGTLSIKIAPAKEMKSFGKKKRVSARFKIKFVQSRSFEIRKSPLAKLGDVKETIASLVENISK